MDTQPLIAAFTFGIIVNAAPAAVIHYIKGYGSSFYRNGLRLVLVTFFITSALWAQISFIATLINSSSTSGCQVALSFASAFDQIARVSLEQGLLWGINHGIRKPSALEVYLPQAVIFLRVILGGVFVGFQRPSPGAVCVASTQIPVVGIATLVADAIIIAILLARAISVGLIKNVQKGSQSAPRSKALLYSVAGLGIWTATSIPLLMGISAMPIVARTAAPATGLSIAIGILTLFKDSLSTAWETAASSYPEAPSPRDFGTTRDLQSRDLSTADSAYPPSRYEDVKGGTVTSISFAPRQQTVQATPKVTLGVGGVPVQGQLFPPLRSQTAPVVARVTSSKKKVVVRKGGKLVISSPVLDETNDQSPLRKIATVDLATAAKNERERRELGDVPQPTRTIGPRSAPQPPALTREEMIKREQSFKRKNVGESGTSKDVIRPSLEPGPEAVPMATTTSTQLSPGVEEIRRRSPRQAPQTYSQEKTPPVTPAKPPQTPATPPARPTRPEASQLPQSSPPRALQRTPSSSTVKSSKTASPPRPPRPDSPPRKSMSSVSSKRVRTGPATAPPPGALPVVPLPPEPSAMSSVPRQSMARGVPPPQPDMPFPPPLQRQTTLDSIESSLSTGQIESRMSILPRNNSVKPNIRPSRQRPRSPPEEPPKSAKTPVQARARAGLPSNPRAQGIKVLAKEQSVNQEQTVMFINSIEYNNPDAVQSIMEGVTGKQPQSPQEPLVRAPSMVHRPRPIPRKPSVDRSIFPAEESPNLYQRRRSLSVGSIRSRKSILRSASGSPGQLPPLPPPPRSAGNPLRPQPNDTRSLTWDEKMKMFYPAPMSAGTVSTRSTRRRSSSVPELPSMPTVYADRQQVPPQDDYRQSQARIVESTKTSVATSSILDIVEAPEEAQVAPNVSKFSITTYQSTVPPVQSWMILPQTQMRSSRDEAKRQSSPVLPAENLNSPLTHSAGPTRDDEIASMWGSIHSPAAEPVNIQRAREVEIPPVPAIAPFPNREADNYAEPASPEEHDDGKEIMTVMLDPSVDHNHDVVSPPMTRQEEVMPQQGSQMGTWHRRVGDHCPTFSKRHTVKARKVPPPAPLVLYRSNMVSMKVQAEPSPLESPDHALGEIKAQLRKFDEPNRDSASSEQRKQRMTLLADLETEMGRYENRWQQMRNDLTTRDSMSTVQTSPNQDSRYGSVRNSLAAEKSLKSVMTMSDRRASRGAKANSHASDEVLSPGSQASDSTRANYWQQKLAEAQNEYRKSRPELVGNAGKKASFLSVATLPPVQLGSPTPPDTDESEPEYEESPLTDAPGDMDHGDMIKGPVTALWRPIAPIVEEASTPVTAMLWTPAAKIPEAQTLAQMSKVNEIDLAFVRPSIEKIAEEPLTIESSRLWEKPVNKRRFSTHGLWRPTSTPAAPKPEQQEQAEQQQQQEEEEEEEESNASKPAIQRPPRRNRRVTMLPDILESPKPLPDKRGTLGIFQFPWGEMSDTATVQPRPQMFMAMPGTMTSGGPVINAALDARARKLESEEYTTSFFDDYEEDEGDNFSDYDMEEFNNSDYEKEEEDDGFDETTLWEIASLLRTRSILSRDSLFPTDDATHQEDNFAPTSTSAVGDHAAGAPLELEVEASKRDSIPLVLDTSAFPLPPRATGTTAALWTDESRHVQVTRAKGLPQPDERTWASYLLSATDVVRAPPRSDEPASISSTSLWSHGSVKIDEGAQSAWLGGLGEEVPTLLWTSHAAQTHKLNLGLPQPDEETWSIYLPSNHGIVRSRARKADPDTLSTTALWSPQSPAGSPQQHGLLWSVKESMRATPAAMWSPAPPVEIVTKGLPPPDAAVWRSYIPSAHDAARVQPRKAEPAIIESTSLWTASSDKVEDPQRCFLWGQQTQKQAIAAVMWTPAQSAESVSYGLAQPETAIWNAYTPATRDTVRTKPRKAVAATIESAQLWSKQTVAKAQSAGPLWGTVGSVTVTKLSISEVKVRSNGMWARPAVIKDQEPVGLFSTAHKRRSDFRSTTKEPAALGTARKPRIAQEPLPRLASARLWNQAPLWTAPAAAEDEMAEGLFSPSHKRSAFRTTHQDPAALKTVRKLRITNEPLPKLASDSLWSPGASTTFTQDWISMSSTGPRSPSVSSSSSDNDSTATDASSIKSTATKASTVGSVFSTIGASFRKVGWGRAKGESSPPPVPKIEHAREAAPITQTRKLRRPEASEADWDVALCMALAASYPPETLQQDAAVASPARKTAQAARQSRRFFSAAEWDNALKQAVEASRFGAPRRKESTDSAQLWARPSSFTAATAPSQSMWKPSEVPAKSVTQPSLAEEQTASARRPRNDPVAPDFSSQDLWRWSRANLASTAEKKDWLSDPAQKRVSRVQLRY